MCIRDRIVTHPRLEWEYVVCPDMTKIYPGGRIPTKIETFLYAVAAEGYESMEAVTDPGERAEVEVAVLRRCKAQLTRSSSARCLGGKWARPMCRTSSAGWIKHWRRMPALAKGYVCRTLLQRAKV